MKKILAVILAALIVAGCTQSVQPSQTQPSQTNTSPILTNQSNVTCIPPHIPSGTSCCPDYNSNGVCDNEEGESCLDVTCDKYCCDNYCSGNTLYYKGRCASNGCQYSSMNCPDACVNGTCMSFNQMYQNESFGISADWTVGSYSVYVEFTNTGIQSIDMMQVAAFLDGKYANITYGNTGLLASKYSKVLNITLNKSITPTCPSMILVTLANGQSQSGTVLCLGKGFSKILVINPWSIRASDGMMRLNILNNESGEINVTGAKGGSYAYNVSNTSLQTFASGESAIIPFVTSNWPKATKSSSSYMTAVTVYYTYNGTALSSTGSINGAYY